MHPVLHRRAHPRVVHRGTRRAGGRRGGPRRPFRHHRTGPRRPHGVVGPAGHRVRQTAAVRPETSESSCGRSALASPKRGCTPRSATSFRFGHRGCGTPTTTHPTARSSWCSRTSRPRDAASPARRTTTSSTSPTSAMDELAMLHAAYQGRELAWLTHAVGYAKQAARPRNRRAPSRSSSSSAVDQFADDMPPAFRRLGELYAKRSLDIVALFSEGERTLIHGDTHSGNLFVDAGRTGFYDWAVAGRGPGVRDVAYFLCNSLPVEMRRKEEDALLARYRSGLAEQGVTLDERHRRTSSTGCSRCTPGSPRRRPPRWARSGSRSTCAGRPWSARRRPSRISMPSACSRRGSALSAAMTGPSC